MVDLADDWEELLIGQLELAIETGSCNVQGRLIDHFDRIVMEQATSSTVDAYLNFKVQAQKAFHFEQLNGKGSALVREHPLNIQLTEMGILSP